MTFSKLNQSGWLVLTFARLVLLEGQASLLAFLYSMKQFT